MKIRFKKTHKLARTPKYAKPGDAAMDLVAATHHESGNKITYDTGIAVEIPQGYVGLVFPRSSVSNTELILANSVGVIDSGYRGSIKLVFKRRPYGESYSVGDRVGQLMIIPYPQITLEQVDELSDTERSDGGFGSTGR